jgi:hypothetical protein
MQLYAKITTSAAEPASPSYGDIWNVPLESATYQPYMWIGTWVPMRGGGAYKAETNLDIFRLNVVVQEVRPDNIIQTGWVWVKVSLAQAFLCMIKPVDRDYQDSDFIQIAG